MVATPKTTTLSTVALVLAWSGASVDAHGSVRVPKAEFLPGKSSAEWVTILTPAWPWEGTGSWKGGDQAGQFSKLSKKNGFDTLRSFLDDKGATCGYSNPDVSPKPIPTDGKVVFQHNNFGFTHQGPCEIWLDNKMVLHNDNCEKTYAGAGVTQSEMPVDFSSCTSKCMLRFYWLGFQNEQWQVYKNCIPLQGTGGSAPSSPVTPPAATPTSSSSAPAPAPAPPSAPATTTVAPTPSPEPDVGNDDEYASPTPKPAPTPAPSSGAPPAPAKNCIRRR